MLVIVGRVVSPLRLASARLLSGVDLLITVLPLRCVCAVALGDELTTVLGEDLPMVELVAGLGTADLVGVVTLLFAVSVLRELETAFLEVVWVRLIAVGRTTRGENVV